MPVSRERKVEQLDDLKARIAQCTAIVVADYKGLKVSQMEKLRNILREFDSSFVVAKKTLMTRALTDLNMPVPDKYMVGAVGFAFLSDDLARGAKTLKDFAKENGEFFHILGGVLGSSVMDATGAVSLADLPSREVQLAQLVGAISAPMSSLASLVTGPHRDLVGLLQARIDKEGGSASDAEAAAA